MGRKISNGKSVKAIVPISTTIVAGNFYLLDGILGIALQGVITTSETSLVDLSIEAGEYETAQIYTGDAFALGSKVYYDTTNKRFTTTAGSNKFAGVVTKAKDDNDVIWFLFMPNSAEVFSASGTGKGFATFVIPGTLGSGTGKVAGFAFNKTVTVTKIKARVKTLPGATAALAIDVNNDGDSLFSAAQEIASTDTAGEFKEFTPDADPATNAFAEDGELTIDIDNPGNTAAADLEVIVEFDQSV